MIDKKMRRLSLWLIAALLLPILLVACGASGNEPSVENVEEAEEPTAVISTTDTETESSEPTAEPTAVPVEEPTAEPEPTDEPEPTAAPVEEETAVPVEEAAAEDTGETTVNITTLDGRQVTIFTTDDRPDNLIRATNSWNTDFSRRSVPYNEILSGGPPRDGIPSIDEPQFVTAAEAEEWLNPTEPIISVEINGDARAYPIQILTWHEIVNDTVGDVPVIVTFCPLCNSAIVFDRRFDGNTFEFGTSGLLRNSDLIMYDRTTETLWQQFTGEGIVGELVGERLTFLPSQLISFAEFRDAFPDGKILSRETGFDRRYGQNPYAGYDDVERNTNPFLFTGDLDGRLAAVERVVTVTLEDVGVDIAYPLPVLAEAGVINDNQGGRDLVVFHTPGTNSALGAQIIAEAADVGATGVFDPNLNGQKLTFSLVDGQIVDNETSSTWNILGQATAGSLAGEVLTPVVHGDHFWFSWAAFKPDTIIYSG
ncbi:MAG: DUF3179 domain-containing (seleno)protein [Chloroflexota bacterium]